MTLDRSIAPKIRIPTQLTLPEPITHSVGGNIPVYFFRTPKIDAVKIEIIGKSGRKNLNQEKQLIPGMTIQMLLEGTNEQHAKEIADFLDFYASEIVPVSSFTHEGLKLLSTKKNYQKIIPLFLSLFETAIFPEDSLEKKKRQKIISLKIEKEKTSSRANQLFRSALFGGDHPFGFDPSENQVNQISRDQLEMYYSKSLWADLEIFISGDFEPNELSSLLQELHHLPRRSAGSPRFDTPAIESTLINESREESVQSSLRFGGKSIPVNDPDYLSLSMFNQILGGFFGSRLIKNIREDKGHTYGIYSSLQSIDEQHYWMIGAEIQKAFKAEVIEQIHYEIYQLLSQKVSREEIESIRNYSIGKMIAQFSNSFDFMDRFKFVHRNSLTMEYYQEKLDFLKSWNENDILEMGQKYFSSKVPIQITVG